MAPMNGTIKRRVSDLALFGLSMSESRTAADPG
jgi:hypothetical protein